LCPFRLNNQDLVKKENTSFSQDILFVILIQGCWRVSGVFRYFFDTSQTPHQLLNILNFRFYIWD